MQFDDSPSLDQFKNGMPEKLPDHNERAKKFRILLLVITLIVVLIGFSVVLKDTHTLENLTATGVVRGRVVDENGQPFHGNIFILGTGLAAQTDADGNFEIRRVPAGEQILIVADEFIGRDFTIQVTTASELQIGEIRFETTAMPPH
jgi:hypothetical protein